MTSWLDALPEAAACLTAVAAWLIGRRTAHRVTRAAACRRYCRAYGVIRR